MSAAAFFVIHGSRDPRPGQELAELLRQLRFTCPDSLIGGGALEAHTLTLSEQIQNFSHQAWTQGFSAVQIVPLFLLPGVHVCEDIPAAVELAQARSPIRIDCLPYLGQYPRLIPFLKSLMPAADQNLACIFLGHGSRRPEAMEWIDYLAAQVQARPAYWTQPASLKQAMLEYAQTGVTEIYVFPYLLFAGKLLTYLNQLVEDVQQELAPAFPGLKIELGDCLRPRPELVALIQQELSVQAKNSLSGLKSNLPVGP